MSGGFATVQPNSIMSINAVEGYPLEDFSADAIRNQIAEAQKVASGGGSEQDVAEAKIELEVWPQIFHRHLPVRLFADTCAGSGDPGCPCEIDTVTIKTLAVSFVKYTPAFFQNHAAKIAESRQLISHLGFCCHAFCIRLLRGAPVLSMSHVLRVFLSPSKKM